MALRASARSKFKTAVVARALRGWWYIRTSHPRLDHRGLPAREDVRPQRLALQRLPIRADHGLGGGVHVGEHAELGRRAIPCAAAFLIVASAA